MVKNNKSKRNSDRDFMSSSYTHAHHTEVAGSPAKIGFLPSGPSGELARTVNEEVKNLLLPIFFSQKGIDYYRLFFFQKGIDYY